MTYNRTANADGTVAAGSISTLSEEYYNSEKNR